MFVQSCVQIFDSLYTFHKIMMPLREYLNLYVSISTLENSNEPYLESLTTAGAKVIIFIT